MSSRGKVTRRQRLGATAKGTAQAFGAPASLGRGCGCDPCNRRYAELRAKGPAVPNPVVWKALLALAKEGKFRGRTVPCFFGSDEMDGHLTLMAGSALPSKNPRVRIASDN